MRKIKVVILLAVVILSLILLNTNAEDVNEGENFCSGVPNLGITINITAKRVCGGEATKHQFDTFEQGDILFVTSLEVINNNNCIQSPINIAFPINVSQTGEGKGLGWYTLNEKLLPKKKYLFIVNGNCSGSVGSGMLLDELGTWKMEQARIQYNGGREDTTTFEIEGYNKSLWKYTFQVESKTTLENLDLIKALTNSSIESANAARGANELSKWAVILSSLAVITSVITLIVGIMQLRLENNQLESGKKQMRIQKKQTRILEEIGNSHKENDNTLNHLKNLQNLTLESEKQQERIEEKQTQILDEIKDILKNSRTPKD